MVLNIKEIMEDWLQLD